MTESRRVALLARPGEACERLRAALREAGGDIVLEADPSTIEPQALRAAAVETVLVALDPAVEDALEKFDEVLGDRGVEVIFDEADLAARREGWDAQRWVRHLAAKLHRHDDVLPPGREPDAGRAAPVEPGEVDLGELERDGIALGEIALDETRSGEPRREESESGEIELDAAELDAAELDAIEPGAIELDAIDLDAVELGDTELGGADLDALERSLAGLPTAAKSDVRGNAAFESATSLETASLSLGGIAFTDDLNDLEFDAGDAAVPADGLPAPSFENDVQDFDALMRDLGGDAAPAADAANVLPPMPPAREFAPAESLPSLGFDIAPLDAPTAKEKDLAMPDFGSLSLEAVSDAPAGMTLKATDAPVAPKFKHDLSDLERRISSLELVGEPDAAPTAAPAAIAEKPAHAAAPAVDVAALEMAPLEASPTSTTAAPGHDARGAILILAGIGGPDAVRQILTALPAGFPRAVLISQRLDGGRYDRLVQQMARAAALPVRLAEVDVALAPGHVYIVPPDIGVAAGDGLRFAAGASQLDALPADDTAVLLLSGADPAVVDAALAHAAHGALVAGQSPDGCYDPAAPVALLARGGTAGAPTDLVQSLLQRWPARTTTP